MPSVKTNLAWLMIREPENWRKIWKGARTTRLAPPMVSMSKGSFKMLAKNWQPQRVPDLLHQITTGETMLTLQPHKDTLWPHPRVPTRVMGTQSWPPLLLQGSNILLITLQSLHHTQNFKTNFIKISEEKEMIRAKSCRLTFSHKIWCNQNWKLKRLVLSFRKKFWLNLRTLFLFCYDECKKKKKTSALGSSMFLFSSRPSKK